MEKMLSPVPCGERNRTVITGDNRTVITGDNLAVITGDNRDRDNLCYHELSCC